MIFFLAIVTNVFFVAATIVEKSENSHVVVLLFFPMQLLSMMLVAYDRLLLVPLLDLFFSMVVNVGALFAEIIVVGVVFIFFCLVLH